MTHLDYTWEKREKLIRKEEYEEGVARGIQALIETCRELNVSKSKTVAKVIEKFQVSEEDSLRFVEKYWEQE